MEWEGVWPCSSLGQGSKVMPILDTESFTAQTLIDGVPS